MTVRYNIFADVEEIAQTNPDTIIIATGGVPDRLEDIPGAELGIPLWEALEAAARLHSRILIQIGLRQLINSLVSHLLLYAPSLRTPVPDL